MEYNKEQQEVLIQDFIDMLFVLRKFPKMSAVHLFHLLTLSSDFAVRPAF